MTSLQNMVEIQEDLETLIDDLQFELESRRPGRFPSGKIDEFQARYRMLDRISQEWKNDPQFKSYIKDIKHFTARMMQAFDLFYQLRGKTGYRID